MRGLPQGEPHPEAAMLPWHTCIIGFVSRNTDRSQEVNNHPSLPKTWMLISSDRMGASAYFKLEFEVDGPVNIRDGEIVKGIIEELGMA